MDVSDYFLIGGLFFISLGFIGGKFDKLYEKIDAQNKLITEMIELKK